MHFVYKLRNYTLTAWGNQSITISEQQITFIIFPAVIQLVALCLYTQGGALVNPSALTKADETSLFSSMYSRFQWVLNHLLSRLMGNPGALQFWQGNPVSGWLLTQSSFVNQAPFPLIRRNSWTAWVEPPQKHVTQWEKQEGLQFSASLSAFTLIY